MSLKVTTSQICCAIGNVKEKSRQRARPFRMRESPTGGLARLSYSSTNPDAEHPWLETPFGEVHFFNAGTWSGSVEVLETSIVLEVRADAWSGFEPVSIA